MFLVLSLGLYHTGTNVGDMKVIAHLKTGGRQKDGDRGKTVRVDAFEGLGWKSEVYRFGGRNDGAHVMIMRQMTSSAG